MNVPTRFGNNNQKEKRFKGLTGRHSFFHRKAQSLQAHMMFVVLDRLDKQEDSKGSRICLFYYFNLLKISNACACNNFLKAEVFPFIILISIHLLDTNYFHCANSRTSGTKLRWYLIRQGPCKSKSELYIKILFIKKYNTKYQVQ